MEVFCLLKTENGNFHLEAARGKWQMPIRFLLSANGKQKLMIAFSANVHIYGGRPPRAATT